MTPIPGESVPEPSLFASLQRLADAFPHPILIGCIAIGLGLVLAGFAGPVRSRSDRARNAKNPLKKRNARKLHALFVAMLLVAGALTAAGTALTINGGQMSAADILRQTREENDRASREYQAKLSTVLSALNSAKQEQTRLLTDEKIKGLQKDLLAWVDDFSARKSDKQRQFDEAKLANTQKEIQQSSDVAPVFSFVLRVLEESFRTYAKKTGSEIQLSLRPLPENYYEADINSPPRSIRFKGEAVWSISVNASPPAERENAIVLVISFTSSDKRGGSLYIYETNKGTKLHVTGSGTFPTPDTSRILGDYEVAGYEETLGRILQRLVEAQLIQTP